MEKVYKDGLTKVVLVDKPIQTKSAQPKYLKGAADRNKVGYFVTHVVACVSILGFVGVFSSPYFEKAWHDPIAGFGMTALVVYGAVQMFRFFDRTF